MIVAAPHHLDLHMLFVTAKLTIINQNTKSSNKGINRHQEVKKKSIKQLFKGFINLNSLNSTKITIFANYLVNYFIANAMMGHSDILRNEQR